MPEVGHAVLRHHVLGMCSVTGAVSDLETGVCWDLFGDVPGDSQENTEHQGRVKGVSM